MQMFVDANAIETPRIHCERAVYGTLSVLWKHRWLVAALPGVAWGAS